jgi:hypothetical protein
MSAIDATEKHCKSCGQVKSTIEFYKQKQISPTGKLCEYYDSMCIPCRIKYGIERRRYIKRQAILYKGGKCIDCGYDDINHTEVFDFHHTNPSEKDYTISANAKSFAKIKPELDKCDLLCANCHRIRHANLD